jgi:PAS domain S-box-containing protein
MNETPAVLPKRGQPMRLLPAAILVPAALALLASWGEGAGLYGTAVGVGIISGSTGAIFALLLWRSARLLDRSEAERTRSEQASKHHAEETSDLYEHAPCGYHSLDRDGRLVRINETELGWLGYPRHEVVRRMRFTDLLTPASLPVFVESLPSFHETGVVHDLKLDMVRKDGTTLPVSLSATAVRDAAGRFLMTRWIALECTERRIAEAKSETLFRLSQDMLCVAGFDGYFKRLNPAWEPVLGYSDEELRKQPFLDFIHPEDREKTIAEVERLSTGSLTVRFENRYRCRNGTYKWLTWSATPLLGTNEIYAAARDVTEQKHIEQALKENSEEISELNRELEAFSYSVSHDLRAPLRHIGGFAELLDKSASASLAEKDRRYLQKISEAARRMGRLIDELLLFSKTARAEMRETDLSLDELVRDVRNDFEPELRGRDVAWKIAALPDVRGDRAMLRLVLVNLISNAIKYTQRREQAVIEIGAAGKNGETIVSVRDNGVGFDMQYGHRLFGVFQRLHSDEEFEGTGIGLANVRRIVHRHGGRTWAEGAVGSGSTFYFSLPRFEMEAA